MRTPVAEQVFGHNKAPLSEVLERDFADIAKETADMAGALAKHSGKIKSEDDFAALGRVILDSKALLKRVEETRVAETNPLHKMQKSIKAHFDGLGEKIDTEMKRLQKAADDYTTRKNAEERRRREDDRRRAEEAAEDELRKADAAKTAQGAAAAEGRAELHTQRAEALSGETRAADVVRTKVAGGGVATAAQGYDFEITDYDAIDLNKLRPYLKREAVETAIRSAVKVTKQHTNIPGVRVFEAVKARFR